MPRPDPTPSPAGSVKRHFWRIFRLLALLSIVVAAIALILISWDSGPISLSLTIAWALGIGLTVLVGTSLMALMFLSSRSGADEAATPHIHHESDEE